MRERIIKYLEHKGISKYRFYKDTGLSNGYLDKDSSLSIEKCEKIGSCYSDLNMNWVLTGEGSMLKEDKKVGGVFRNEVYPVPEDAYMLVEYADLSASAGTLGVSDFAQGVDVKTRLVPREYETGNFIVVRVSGDSMDDGTSRSLCDGDEVLVKEEIFDPVNGGLPIRSHLFVIATTDGNVLKQITEINRQEGYITCHSFNTRYSDYRIYFDDIHRFFAVRKITYKRISF